ncbi:MAG: nucleotidyltransferase family protein [Bacteroidota bacterium]|nr:nucleotidyltransferase family protein [Bacteroidota bacterium]
MHYHVENCAIIILAAGKSSRLGTPKQIITFQGKTLLQHAVDEAVQTSIQPIVVVVGAHDDAVVKTLDESNIHIIKNLNWEDGISSSIRGGLEALLEINTSIDGVIIMVCDQPHVTHFLLESLLKEQQKSGQPIVASSYENILGTPVLFHKSFFKQLMRLAGDSGARKLIKEHPNTITFVSFPKGNIDIDTLEDYEKLINSSAG